MTQFLADAAPFLATAAISFFLGAALGYSTGVRDSDTRIQAAFQAGYRVGSLQREQPDHNRKDSDAHDD